MVGPTLNHREILLGCDQIRFSFVRVTIGDVRTIFIYFNRYYSPTKRLARPLELIGLFCSFSRPRSEGWPHHGRTFSIYPCPLSFWLTLPRRVLSISLCCPSRPCVVWIDGICGSGQIGTVKNEGVENAGVEISAPCGRGGQCRSELISTVWQRWTVRAVRLT